MIWLNFNLILLLVKYLAHETFSQGFTGTPQKCSVSQRLASLIRFREKRKERNFDKKVRYKVRKEVALRYGVYYCYYLVLKLLLWSNQWTEIDHHIVDYLCVIRSLFGLFYDSCRCQGLHVLLLFLVVHVCTTRVVIDDDNSWKVLHIDWFPNRTVLS